MALRSHLAFPPRSRENRDAPPRPLGAAEVLEMEVPPTPGVRSGACDGRAPPLRGAVSPRHGGAGVLRRAVPEGR